MSFRTWLRALALGPRRRLRLEQLREAVQTHCPVLPVVGAQLREANRQVEQAVAQVGANFERMVARAREGAGEASRLVGALGDSAEDGATGVDGLLSSSRTTLEDLLRRIVLDSELCAALVQRMASVERDMGQIVRALADVDRISFGNTILALNAKIEAAHMGERGQGFELVAQELWTQSQRSEQLTEGIRVTIAQLSREAKAAVGEIGAMACADSDRIATLRSHVQDALDRLERAHREMQSAVADGGMRSEALSQEIASAVQTLQFQDRIGQRIGHIVEALEAMQSALAAPLESMGQVGGRHAGQSTAASLLASSYTMDGERAVHAAAAGEQLTGRRELGDVEIF